MFKANLSFAQLNDYLDFLVGNNLISHTKTNGKERYLVTSKDLEFLQMHNEITVLLKKE